MASRYIIGNQRRRFSIRSRSTTRNDLGERVTTYTEQFQIRGHLRRTGSSVSSEQGSLRTEDRFIIETRYRAGFVAGLQAVDLADSRTYYIETILDRDNKRRWIELTASEAPASETAT